MNRSNLIVALILALPSIGSWIGANIITKLLDRWQKPVKSEIAALQTEILDLEKFVTLFQSHELGRATLNLIMTATSAETPLRYAGDRIYRAQSASVGSLRRAAAILHQNSWSSVIKPYEDIVREGYDTPEAVNTLQEFENTLIAAALSRLTDNQDRLNILAGVNARYEWWRGFLKETFLYLALALSIFLFFFELKRKEVGG